MARNSFVSQSDLGSFYDRRLFCGVTKGFDPDDADRLSTEIELVMQEKETDAIVFLSIAPLETFEALLAAMVRGQTVTCRSRLRCVVGLVAAPPLQSAKSRP